MKLRILHIAFTLSLIIVMACEKDFDITIKESEKQMVVNGLFNQSAPIQMSITESFSPYVETVNIRDLTRSEVALLENGSLIENMIYFKHPDEEYGKYYSTSIPKQGNNYRIEITDPVYGRVTANSAIPSHVIISDSKSNWTPWGEDTLLVIRFNFEFILEDPPEDNYYYMSIGCPLLKPNEITGIYEAFDYQYAEIYTADIARPELYLKNGWLFDDKVFNGAAYTISGTATMYTHPCCDFNDDVIIDKSELYVFLENLSNEAYEFHSSYAQRLKVQDDIYSEPGSVYSNINNGVGVFGGVNLTENHIPIVY